MSHSVLLIEDDQELRKLYRSILEKAGYTVSETANGAEALQFLLNYTPDLIITDMLMPMLGGEAVIQRIRQMPALRNTRLIVLTAYPRYEAPSLNLNIDRFLVKPLMGDALLKAISEVMVGE